MVNEGVEQTGLSSNKMGHELQYDSLYRQRANQTAREAVFL